MTTIRDCLHPEVDADQCCTSCGLYISPGLSMQRDSNHTSQSNLGRRSINNMLNRTQIPPELRTLILSDSSASCSSRSQMMANAVSTAARSGYDPNMIISHLPTRSRNQVLRSVSGTTPNSRGEYIPVLATTPLSYIDDLIRLLIANTERFELERYIEEIKIFAERIVKVYPLFRNDSPVPLAKALIRYYLIDIQGLEIPNFETHLKTTSAAIVHFKSLIHKANKLL